MNAEYPCPDCGGVLENINDGFGDCLPCGSRWELSEVGGRPFLHGGAVLVTLADVQPESVSWLWTGRIPRGCLTAISGNPGVGKSWLSLAVATAVTLGAPLPGDSERREPESVLILTAEDGLGDTVRPRLDTMGADVSRIRALTAVRNLEGVETWPSLNDHVPVLGGILSGGGYGLVIIDPLNAYLGSGVDAFRDNEVRGILGPLAQLAERHGVAIVCISHLTKSRRDIALYRTQGSIGFVGAPRAILMAGQDAETGERAIVPVKVNLAELAPAVGYEIRDGVFYWLGESTLTAADILAPDREAGDRSALDEAVGFLRDTLTGDPQPGKDIQREAAGLGISGATLRRARERLGVQWKQPGKDGERGGAQVMWSLPPDSVAHDKTLSNRIPLVSGNGQNGAADEQPNTDARKRWKLLPGDDITDPAIPPWSNGKRRCQCGLALSVVAVGDRCGRCATLPEDGAALPAKADSDPEIGLEGQEGYIEKLAPLTDFVSVGGTPGADVDPLNPDACTLCGAPDLVGFAPDGSRRCEAHYLRETDGPLVAAAAGEMGAA